MARKIRFPLEMNDGVMIRNIEELRDHFDLERVVGYFLSGKLMIWLKDRNYKNEAEELAKLVSNSEDVERDICRILSVEYIENSIDIEKLKLRNRKISKLKEYTDDEEIIKNIEYVAFDNNELKKLLQKNLSQIYIAGGKFIIPIDISNKKFIGLGNPTAVINSNEVIDFKEKGIIFENIHFNKEYYEIMQAKKIEENNANHKKKHEYKTSDLLDYMLNDEDRLISRRYFNILQDGLLNIELDIDKQSRPLLKILNDANLCNKFDIDVYGKSLKNIIKNEDLNIEFLNYKNRIV